MISPSSFCGRLLPNRKSKSGDAMSLVLQVNIRIKPENIASFMQKCVENAKAARSEPGCRQFEVLVDPEDKTSVMLFEVYDDQKAFDAHQAGAAFKKYVAEAVPLLASRERHFWKNALWKKRKPRAPPDARIQSGLTLVAT